MSKTKKAKTVTETSTTSASGVTYHPNDIKLMTFAINHCEWPTMMHECKLYKEAAEANKDTAPEYIYSQVYADWIADGSKPLGSDQLDSKYFSLWAGPDLDPEAEPIVGELLAQDYGCFTRGWPWQIKECLALAEHIKPGCTA